jgi:hypothetical protein
VTGSEEVEIGCTKHPEDTDHDQVYRDDVVELLQYDKDENVDDQCNQRADGQGQGHCEAPVRTISTQTVGRTVEQAHPCAGHKLARPVHGQSPPASRVDLTRRRAEICALTYVPVIGTPGEGALYPKLSPGKCGLAKTSYALIDHLRSIDKRRIRRVFGQTRLPRVRRSSAARPAPWDVCHALATAASPPRHLARLRCDLPQPEQEIHPCNRQVSP